MGFLDTLKGALGLQRVLQVREPGPFGFTRTAREALAVLPEGISLHISAVPSHGGHLVHVEEVPPQGPPPPGYEDFRITVSDQDLQRMRGLNLDYRQGRWAVTTTLEVRGRETPNPNGRTYLVDRMLADGPPAAYAEDGPPLAQRLLAISGVESVLLRDNTVTVEREQDVPWDGIDAEVDANLRQYFLLCGQAVPTARPIRDAPTDDLEAAVWQVLQEKILPGVHRDGGDMQLVGIDDGVVKVHMTGACRSCPASTMTLSVGVERALKEAFPDQIHGVEAV